LTAPRWSTRPSSHLHLTGFEIVIMTCPPSSVSRCADRSTPRARSFRHGPPPLNFYQYDTFYHDSPDHTDLTVIAGMQNTWTRPHVDKAGDSVWQLMIEGEKRWMLGRPETKEAMKAMFHKHKTVSWTRWKEEERKFLQDYRCVMVVTKPGDIIYIPAGWVHMVKHITDTLSLNSNMLYGWSLGRCLRMLKGWTEVERDQYERIVMKAQAEPDKVGLWGEDKDELMQVWERRKAELEDMRQDQEKKEREEGEKGRESGSQRKRRKM